MGNSNPSAQRGNETLFVSKAGEVYRIPALIFDSENKTLLAFAEKRTTKYDNSAVALVMKKGILSKGDLKVEWSDSKEVVTKRDLKGKRPMNPCPIYSNGKLHLFFMGVEGTIPEFGQIFWGINKARLYYITTENGGKTWSTPTDLTDTLPETKNWATFAVGPGHGIETDSGEFIVPTYAYPSCSSGCKRCRSCLATFFCWCGCKCCCCPPPHSLIIYRAPNEESFRCGDKLEETSLECQIAEISNNPDKRLYLNARSQGGLRVEAFLDDRGNNFIILPSKLVETGGGCQGSLVSFPAQPEGAGSSQGAKWLLYSHPTSESKRMDLGVYLNKSPLEENAWSKPWIIKYGPSGYSDLAYMGNSQFACLMECGNSCATEQIACLLFTYDKLQGFIKE